MRTDDEAAYSSPNLSHAGFMDLQCPHLLMNRKKRRRISFCMLGEFRRTLFERR
jgi:hypothetical protein